MASRLAWVFVLVVELAGCGPGIGTGVDDLTDSCLKKRPGDIKCCLPDDHLDKGTCCPPGSHAVIDVEHEDWKICVWDDAGADAP